jgi:hypothetical protein
MGEGVFKVHIGIVKACDGPYIPPIFIEARYAGDLIAAKVIGIDMSGFEDLGEDVPTEVMAALFISGVICH